jgi:hypothetical protein
LLAPEPAGIVDGSKEDPMRTMLCAVVMCLFAVSAASALADDHQKHKKGAATAKGELTLKGTMLCGKCALSETKSCQNVLKVEEGGKEVKYYLAKNEVSDNAHGQVCGGSHGATVKGTVKQEGGKKVLTASEVKYD